MLFLYVMYILKVIRHCDHKRDSEMEVQVAIRWYVFFGFRKFLREHNLEYILEENPKMAQEIMDIRSTGRCESELFGNYCQELSGAI